MKIFELCKKHEINFHDFKIHLKKHGLEYKGPNKAIPEDELERLESLATEFIEQQKILDAEKEARKKGAFVGIVYDRKNGQFLSVELKASYRELVENGLEFNVLGEHTTVFGAMINVKNKTPRVINDRVVQKYGKLEE